MLGMSMGKLNSSLYLLQSGFQNILQSSIPLDYLMQLKSKPFLLTQRHQNHSANHINQTDETIRLYNQNKILKFSSIKKQNILAFGYSTGQSAGITKDQNGGREISSGYGGVRRKFIYDQQTMKDMIQVLKQQNNELKAVVKMQQTQINYYEEQQKNLVHSSTPACPNIKKLQLQNHHLKKQSQALASELQKIKKSIKVTSIKQLETVNKVYEEQVKNLTAKLLGYEKSTKNLQEINNIIQRDFLSSVKNKELEAVLEEKMADLEQSAKVIRKLKNIIGQKNAEYQQLKQEKEKMEGSLNKVKITQQYVPKAQLLAKKKQLLSMTQMLEKMQAKLIQCESKAQALQQQNIDNMNRQTNKRKQVIAEFQRLKKNYEALQQALAQALKKNSDVSASLRMDCMPTLNAEFRKPKCPIIVKVQNLKQVIQHITFNLQLQSIPPHQAPLHLSPYKQHQSPDNQTNNPHEQTKEQRISIRQLIKIFSQFPFNVAVFEQKQLLARYLVEIESEEENQNQFVNFDAETSLAYVRAIFKQVLKEYFVYGKEEEDACCAVVEQVYRRNEGKLKSGLSRSSIGVGQQKGNSHQYLEYLEQIQKQNQLNEYHLQFIKYWILKNTRNNYKSQSSISSNSNSKLNNSKNKTTSQNQKSIDEFVTFQEFLLLFRVQSYCTFITQDPNEEHSQHELKIQQQAKQTGSECADIRQGQKECRTDNYN